MMATNSRTPGYCAVCGSRLVPNGTVTGYDPYTGEPVSEISLHCPNPTVTVSLGRRSVTQHPTWTNYAGEWVQN